MASLKFRSQNMLSKLYTHSVCNNRVNIICEYDEVINYTLDGVSIHPVTTKIQLVAGEEGNSSGISP
jgi:hypothetical protein